MAGTIISIQSEDSGTTIQGTAKLRTNGSDSILNIDSGQGVSRIDLIFKSPLGTVSTKQASVKTPSAGDGVFKYTTTTTFFTDEPGKWEVQAKYTFDSGKILYSNIKSFHVGEVLQ